MLDAAAYRANEINAKRGIADWRLSNINDPYIFQNQGFPVRADSFLDLAQILDTMQEDRFDYYMKELGGFTDEDLNFFVSVCLDFVDFYHSVFQRERVLLPLSTIIAHFVIYKKLCGYAPQFSRLLEIGPGCGYLSFFLRDHSALLDYTQIESTESFYLLQSHINSHVFGAHFDEHALSKKSADDHDAYYPKLKWHNPFHYEDQKIIRLGRSTVCNHYPWWRIGEAADRKYEIVSSNANLNEFSREALFQYLSLIRDVLADDGVIIAQCLGGGPPTYDTIFTHMKAAGFVPIALVQIDNVPGRIFVVSNGIFVGEKHPLYSTYAERKPMFPTLDRERDFVNKMYFINEQNPERKKLYSTADILSAVSDRFGGNARGRKSLSVGARSSDQSRRAGSAGNGGGIFPVQPAKVLAQAIGKSPSKGHIAEICRLQRVAHIAAGDQSAPASIDRHSHQMSASGGVDTADVETLRRTLINMRSSKSWRVTAPIRRVVHFIKSPGSSYNDGTAAPLSADVQRLRSEIQNLQSSTSWRITAPLRFLRQRMTRH
jgi:hypothetical protein